MAQFYQEQTAEPSPLTLATAKASLKITSSSQDLLIQALIDTVTEFGEKFTGHNFRGKTWLLFEDSFSSKLDILNSPIEQVTLITRLVDGVAVDVPANTYYLKKGLYVNSILLNEGKAWPTDGDVREQGITIAFTSQAYPQINLVKQALLMHLTNMFANRGDGQLASNSGQDSAASSGALALYKQFRIPRI